MFKFDARKLATACLVGSVISLSGCGDNPDKLVSSAQTAFDKRDFNTATIQLKNALQVKPEHAEARLLFARVLMAQNDFAGAERELRKAQDAGSKPDDIMPLLVTALVAQGQADKAIAEFGNKQAVTPQGKAALAVALGNAYAALSDFDNAGKQFFLAEQAQPGLVAAGIGQARIKLANGDSAAAMASLDAIIKAQPNAIEALLLKGDVLAAQKKTEEAIAVFKSTAAGAPEDTRPLLRLIPLYIQGGKQDEIASAIAAFRKIAPNDIRATYFEGAAALIAGKFVVARDAANTVLRVAPDNDLALVLAASANIQLGDALTSETMLQKVIQRRPEWPLPRRLLAQSYLAVRDSAHALEIIKPMLDKGANDGELLSMAGQAYMLSGDFAKATEYLAKASALAPSSSTAQTRLGMARMAAGDDVRAMQDLEAVSSRDPDSIVADTAIISTHLRKGDNAKAMQALAALEKKQPNNAATFNIKGSVLLATKDVAGARKAFERALELQPGNIGAISQLARLDVVDGKPQDARKRFDKLIQQEPKNVRAYVLLAQLQAETGASTADVRATLEKGVGADPTKNEARIALVQLLLRAGDTKQALNVAQQAQAADPDNKATASLLGRVQLAAGEKQQAVTTFQKLQSAEPNSPAALIDLADAQHVAGDEAAAEASLRKAIELKPDFVDAYQRLASILVKNKRGSEAITLAQDLQTKQPKSPVGFMLEAEIAAQDKRWLQVETVLQQAFQRAKTAQIVLGLRTALLQQGKTAEAQKLVADWVKINPKDSNVRMQVAEDALNAGKYAEALEQLKAANAATPGNAVVLNNLAWAANKQSDPKAVEYAEQALKAAPKMPAVMETAGTIFFERGQQQRGLALLKQAVEVGPKASAVRLGYAKALAKSGDKSAARKEATTALEGVPAEMALHKEIDAFIKTL
ncbi:XrtA/PEP-CTERM system TPR-repeat protein PrsT [Uliginosibacterium sp. H3]|uniref:XrtA/PEP-CTERM system TPR-repeat protein PrsT n=1 Tax=Uliginosibacterium silvisoli TaxID=3114758 RepID=A0ABU6K642_9RHOO|nr:XrtA/PEP-CTERM system TPR-repeat protein PrsT [Uliginosibacterium sp. H3]